MQLRSDYDQLTDFKPIETTTGSNLYVLEQVAELRTAIRELETRTDLMNDHITNTVLQKIKPDQRVDNLILVTKSLEQVFKNLNDKVNPYLTYH